MSCACSSLFVLATIVDSRVSHVYLHLMNRPFPSSCLPPLQSESKCEIFFDGN